MALSADQRATLQLLLERGQSYDDLSALLEVSDGEVRERARSALADLAGADPDRNVGLTDYLLGQADPIDRADVVRHLRDDPDDHRLAAELVERLREVVPAAELPRLPGAPRAGRFLRRPPGPPAGEPEPAVGAGPEGGIGVRLTRQQARLLVGLAAGAVLLIAVVLAIAGAFGDGDPEPSGDATPAVEEVPLALRPVGDSNARGRLTFGVTEEDQSYVDVRLSDLEPPADDEAYLMWFLLTEDSGFPFPTLLPVNDRGRFNDRLVLPVEALLIAQQAESIVIARNDQQRLAQLINRAVEGETEIDFPGGTVLEAAAPAPDAGEEDGA